MGGKGRLDISADGVHCYQMIWRKEPGPLLPIVGFRPGPETTADAQQDRVSCAALSTWNRYAGFRLVYLYTARVDDHAALRGHPEPVGPDNHGYLMDAAASNGFVVCAWGLDAREPEVRAFVETAGLITKLLCCRTMPNGAPVQPRQVFADGGMETWEPNFD